LRRLHQIPRGMKIALLAAIFIATVGINQATLLGVRQHKDNATFALTSEVLYIPDIRQLRLMTLGYDQAAADLVWIRSLEYFAAHFKSDRKYPWLEYLLNQIIDLDPGFTKVYHWAGANVLYGRRFTNKTVLRSNRFYEMALAHDADDYEAAYRLGLNYYVELKAKDPALARKYRETGLYYFERAANTPGAPDRIRRLIASISSKLGKHQLALQYLLDLYMQTTDPEQKESLRARLERMKEKLGTSSNTDEAFRFERDWKASYGYLPASMYAILGEPNRSSTVDIDWRGLVPDIDLGQSEQQQAIGIQE
jgi:hypothetical protein